MRILCCLLASGCVAGIGPVIGFGTQGNGRGPRTLGLQLGAEASFDLPVAEATVSGGWIQSNGLFVGGHLDLGWDSAFDPVGNGQFGGRVGIGGIKFDDDRAGRFLGILEANGSRQLGTHQCSEGWSGKAISVSLSIRFNADGIAVALSPRFVKFGGDCGQD